MPRRETRHRDQREGLVTTLPTMGAAPIGGLYFALLGAAGALPRFALKRARISGASVVVWFVACVAAFALVVIGRW
jgi:hypothetical protein